MMSLMERYGVGWYGDNASIAHTGFIFSREGAEKIAREGAEAPDFWEWAEGQVFAVDELTDGSDLPVVRADLETESQADEVYASWLPGR